MILREFCVENLIDLIRLDKVIILCVEFCDNFVVGGIIFSYGVIKEVN